MAFRPRSAVDQSAYVAPQGAAAPEAPPAPVTQSSAPSSAAPASHPASPTAESLVSRFSRRPAAGAPVSGAPAASRFSRTPVQGAAAPAAPARRFTPGASSAPSAPDAPDDAPSSAASPALAASTPDPVRPAGPSLSPRLERLLQEVTRIEQWDAKAQDAARLIAAKDPVAEEARLMAIYRAAAPAQRETPSLQVLLRTEPSAVALELKKDGKARIWRAAGYEQEEMLQLLRGASLESVSASDTPFPAPAHLWSAAPAPSRPKP